MRIYLFIGALLVSFSLSAQNQYAPWDFRNTNLINAQVGIGINIGNQNSNFYLFTKFDLCPMCLLAKETIEQEWRQKGVSNYFTERGFRPNLHIEFLTQKNFRYYGKKFDNDDKNPRFKSNSWTFLTRFGLSADILLGFNQKRFLEQTSATTGRLNHFFQDSRLRLRYDIVGRFNTWYFRRVSNTVGDFTFSWGKLDDSYGIDFYGFANDILILPPFNRILKKLDHGETTAWHFNLWVRPAAWLPARNGGLNANYTDVNKLSVGWTTRVFTARRRVSTIRQPGARLGQYQTIENDSIPFHHYRYVTLGVEGDYFNGYIRLGQDNLRKGRNHQRWGHNAQLHESYKNRTTNRMAPENFGIAWKHFKGVRKEWKMSNPTAVERVKTTLKQLGYEDAEITTALIKKQMKLYKDFQKSLFVGTVGGSPLFPWEKDPKLYRYPTFLFEIDLNLYGLLVQPID